MILNSSDSGPLRLSARLTGFFLSFVSVYTGVALFLEAFGVMSGAVDIAAAALAAAACLVLWKIPIRGGCRLFSYRGSTFGAAICCMAATIACAVQWPSAGLALIPAVVTAAHSAVLEELVFRRAPAEMLKRSGGQRMVAKAAVGAISTGAFVLLHQNADYWLVADKVIFGLIAFCLTLITTSLLLPVLLHLTSNLVLQSAVQFDLGAGSGALLAMDILLMGAVAAALFLRTRMPDYLPRMTRNR